MPTRKRRLIALLHVPLDSTQPAVTPGGSDSSEATDPTLGYLVDLLTETREELTRADSKASLLLAAIGVILGALIGGLAGSKWTPFDLDGKIQWIWWLGVAAAAFGVLSIALSVYPRIHQSGTADSGVPAYYGDVARYKDVDAFRHVIEKMPDVKERLINQTFALSGIVLRKYLLLRRGLRCILLAITACTLAVVINILLGR